jgi:hypothetical protein
MAKIELAALSRQCLDRRTSDMTRLAIQAEAWKNARRPASCDSGTEIQVVHITSAADWADWIGVARISWRLRVLAVSCRAVSGNEARMDGDNGLTLVRKI